MVQSLAQAQRLRRQVNQVMDILVLKINTNIALLLCLSFSISIAGCSKTKKDGSKTNIEAIMDGTFATDEAMQEERVKQGNYINEQEQRYEQ